ncbi:MAG: GntP family permease [bacterium]|nr:GntP family permease [bacterium]
MSVILIAALGVALVLVLILAIRLHPLLALLLGSLFLLALTPTELILQNQLKERAHAIQAISTTGLLGFASLPGEGKFVEYAIGERATTVGPEDYIELRSATAEQIQAAWSETGDTNLIWYQATSVPSNVSVGSQLVASSAWEQALDSTYAGLGERLADGFTKTFRKLGIPVTMAAIVGICLLQSGAATRLVQAIMRLFGPRGTAPALTASGFVLGIPVFFDNVFYLLLPLAKAVGKAQPDKFLTAVMAIIVGATMAHSLVPPTPGPLFVAEQMQVSVGLMMLAGLIVGGIAAACGFAYGQVCGRWVRLEPDQVAEGETTASTAEETIPLWFAALPIALPIAVLGGSEIVEAIAKESPSNTYLNQLQAWTAIGNDPSLVFIGAALAALILLRRFGTKGSLSRAVSRALSDAGVIVLLTCAGGAFGAALQQLGLANAIGAQFSGLTQPWGLLFTAFFLTTIIRAAQGSATVAMLTSSAIIAPVMESTSLPFHPIYMALAIGCGSKPLPWMNDSGFWQVTTMTGMTPTQTLSSFSVALTIMGVVGFAVTLLGAWLLPLV